MQVKCKEGKDCHGLTEGVSYEVVRSYEKEHGHFTVVVNNYGDQTPYYSWRFETVKPQSPATRKDDFGYDTGVPLKVYVGGALANDNIVTITKALKDAGYDAFSEWYTPGPEADVLWRDYEMALGFDYREALQRPSAQNTFNFDKRHIDECDVFVMVLPCGKSAHLELGYAIGKGKRGIIYMPQQPERWDVMYNFADRIVYSSEELLEALR